MWTGHSRNGLSVLWHAWVAGVAGARIIWRCLPSPAPHLGGDDSLLSVAGTVHQNTFTSPFHGAWPFHRVAAGFWEEFPEGSLPESKSSKRWKQEQQGFSQPSPGQCGRCCHCFEAVTDSPDSREGMWASGWESAKGFSAMFQNYLNPTAFSFYLCFHLRNSHRQNGYECQVCDIWILYS